MNENTSRLPGAPDRNGADAESLRMVVSEELRGNMPGAFGFAATADRGDAVTPAPDRRTTRHTEPVTQQQIMDLIYHLCDCRIAYHGQGPEVRAAVVAVKAALTEAGIQ